MEKVDMDELTRLASLAMDLSATSVQRDKAMRALEALISQVKTVAQSNRNQGDVDVFPDVPTRPVRYEKQYTQDVVIEDHWHVSDTEWNAVVDEFDSSVRMHKSSKDQGKKNVRQAVPELKSMEAKSKSTSQANNAKTILPSVWNMLHFWKKPSSEQKTLDLIQQELQKVTAGIEKLQEKKAEKRSHQSRHHTKPVDGNLNLEARLKDLTKESKPRHHRAKSVEDDLNLEARLQALKK